VYLCLKKTGVYSDLRIENEFQKMRVKRECCKEGWQEKEENALKRFWGI